MDDELLTSVPLILEDQDISEELDAEMDDPESEDSGDVTAVELDEDEPDDDPDDEGQIDDEIGSEMDDDLDDGGQADDGVDSEIDDPGNGLENPEIAESEVVVTDSEEVADDAPVPTPFDIVGDVRTFILNQLFDEEAYLEQNPDLAQFQLEVQASGFTFDLRQHFFEFGQFEGREFSAFFNITEYAQSNPDVVAVISREDLLTHFLDVGLAEGREFSNFFSVNTVLYKVSDN